MMIYGIIMDLSPNICFTNYYKNYPYTMIYREEDIDKI